MTLCVFQSNIQCRESCFELFFNYKSEIRFTSCAVLTKSMNASVNMEVKLNVNEVNQNLQHFGWVDYVVFTFMLICCAAIGVYFGFIDKNRKRKHGDSNEVAQEYLMGGMF